MNNNLKIEIDRIERKLLNEILTKQEFDELQKRLAELRKLLIGIR